MTAGSNQDARDRCLKAGCTEFVTKPEKPEELLGIVARVLKVRQRESERITVVFNVTGHLGSRQVVGRAANLSTTGLLLETGTPLTVGSILQIEFFLPKTRHAVKVKGEVTRADPNPDGGYRSGVRFTDLSQADQEQILDYVSA